MKWQGAIQKQCKKKKNDYKIQENTKGIWREFRQKYIPEDTDGFSKFKETTNSVEQQLKRERLIQRKSGLKKMELERMWVGGKQKKKMNVPIETKTRLDAAERREDKPKTIGQVESNTETNS